MMVFATKRPIEYRDVKKGKKLRIYGKVLLIESVWMLYGGTYVQFEGRNRRVNIYDVLTKAELVEEG